MESQINMQPLGPDGIRQRMEELRSRMAQVLPKKADPTFQQTLEGQIQGDIGGSLSPMDPFGPGMSTCVSKPSPQIDSIIKGAATANGLDPMLLDSLVATESSYDINARSGVGAMGLTQLMPDTARSLGVSNPFDPVQNVNGGAKYLSNLLGQFGDVKLALAAYNAGPNAVLRHGGIPPYKETQDYVRKVLANYEQRKVQG